MKLLRIIPLLLLYFSGFCSKPTIILTGEVVYVTDGDTFHLKINDSVTHTIRIIGIDCPEINQPFGLEAKEFVISQILNKIVHVHVSSIDRYNRRIGGVVYDCGDDVNLFKRIIDPNYDPCKSLVKEILSTGYGWHYKKYSSYDEYSRIESIAKENKVGLWADDNPIPPWEWRVMKQPSK